jgi:DNA-binding MarR family transcriptional regulator
MVADDDRGFLIGALLGFPNLALTARVFQALQARGFTDISPAHQPVMKVLGPEGNTITDLARRVGMTKQSMGYLVDQLESCGYVERIPSPADGRAVIVRRTKKGWVYNRAALEEVTAIHREWTALLGQAKMARLTALLRELSSKLGFAYEGSVPDLAARMPGFPTSRVGIGGLGSSVPEPDRSAH